MAEPSEPTQSENQAEAHMASLQADLAALRADLQSFTATVSHDLRAPLRHIVSYVQLVQEDAGPQLTPEVQGFLATIADSARYMGHQMDALRELAQVGNLVPALEPVHTGELVAELVAQLTRQHPARTLDWRIAADLPVVHADARLLRIALLQVLGNAIKFTAPRASAVLSVCAAPSADGQTVQINVRDNGVGYNPSQQGALFKPFGRLHSVQKFEGMGMGLLQCRAALQRMGASVSLEGALDAGCCATLTLPLV